MVCYKMELPKIIINKKSDVENVKELMEIWEDLMYRPFDEDYIITYECTLRSLSQYVTLIGFTESQEVGEIDIDWSVSVLRNDYSQMRESQCLR